MQYNIVLIINNVIKINSKLNIINYYILTCNNAYVII